jgi:alkylated DNA repair dioxygenase AlkB
MHREFLSKESWLDSCTVELSEGEFEKIWNLCPKERGKVMVFGEKTTPRFQQSYIRDYTFSGIESKALPLPKELEKYLCWANSIPEYGGKFNQALLNFYSDGTQYIGSHADSENQLIPDSPIMTITLCEILKEKKIKCDRTFRIRIKDKEKKIVKDVLTINGLVLTMGGKFQKQFRHEIVKIAGQKGENTPGRISITFRQFL